MSHPAVILHRVVLADMPPVYYQHRERQTIGGRCWLLPPVVAFALAAGGFGSLFERGRASVILPCPGAVGAPERLFHRSANAIGVSMNVPGCLLVDSLED